MKAAGILLQIKSYLGLQNYGGLYSPPQKYENTEMPKILAYTKDKVVIHQNVVV